jgi:malonyl CoA-acyl carrier protein transacylase
MASTHPPDECATDIDDLGLFRTVARMARPVRVLGGLLGLVSALTACGAVDGISMLRIVEESPGTLSITLSCSENVEIEVEESASQVAVRVASGEAIDGDCAGSAVVVLVDPIGDRSVVVAGDRWVVRRDCEGTVAMPEDEGSEPCPVLDR